MARRGSMNSKSFWNTVKPFLTNKGFLTCENITVENKEKLISNNLKLAEIFNTYFRNIVEKLSGILLSVTGNPNNPLKDSNSVKNIIEQYENHPSIITIKYQANLNAGTYDFLHANAEEINKIIKDVNPKKATGPDKIPRKIIKLSTNIIDSHFTNIYIINKESFSKNVLLVIVLSIRNGGVSGFYQST